MDNVTVEARQIRCQGKEFDFRSLFREVLGWDHGRAPQLEIAVRGQSFRFEPVSEKGGLVVYLCQADAQGQVPDHATRCALERQVAKRNHQHIIIFVDGDRTRQVWQWVQRQPGHPVTRREYRFQGGESAAALIDKLQNLHFAFEAEEDSLDVERVTKRFYDRFREEHARLRDSISGITNDRDREWYTSVMLNRLMFLYFIQRKGFLAGDIDYLWTNLTAARPGNLTYYRYLRTLFHEGLSKPQPRPHAVQAAIGEVPYLNGGLFQVHPIEAKYAEIEIADASFERLLTFYAAYDWHLDDRSGRKPQSDEREEITPDVLGYIFEKYINQKQMGAYYTKEDITEYIAKNAVIPFLLDKVKEQAPEAFAPDGYLWSLLRSSPDRYIYEVVRQGTDLPLPEEIGEGIHDLARRGSWNKPAAVGYALPTESWREHIGRRQRLDAIRAKITAGEICTVEQMIAHNLDLRQLAQDMVENAQDVAFFAACYRAISSVTILDPTCGSGAFLFAALNILEPLYEAGLDKIESLLDETPNGQATDEAVTYLRQVRDSVRQEANGRYFIYKSIILHNLFGVDIMEEATEICKLRLFLKLAAQVEDVSQIRPLPDIDLNIRAGNALVGFGNDEAVKQSVLMKEAGQAPSLRRLQEKLNLDLAREYGADRSPTQFQQWYRSHQPFHWFVHFYGILSRGGFDVIIGNPPYVETKNVTTYALRGFHTLSCGDLYACTLERALDLLRPGGRLGFIVPMSCFAVEKFGPLQQLFYAETGSLFVSHWSGDAHPSKLFEGVDKRLEIVLAKREPGVQNSVVHSSRYLKWYAVERPFLFHLHPVYEPVDRQRDLIFPASVPKVNGAMERSILAKLRACPQRVGTLAVKAGTHPLYYTRKVSFFLQFLDFVPEIRDGRGNRREPSELKSLGFRTEAERDLALACLSTSLFYWYNIITSDCRNLNKREVDSFPVPGQPVPPETQQALSAILRRLMQSYRENATPRTVTYKEIGAVTVPYFNFRPSKKIIDELDRLLAPLYGLTPAEADFIVNDDIKYRMGAEEDE